MSHYNIQQQYAAYKNAHHTTDNKTQQVVMIYDGMMRVIHQAKQAIAEGNIQSRYTLLDKVCQVILGLQASLDFENGGDIAHILDSYYNSLYTKIHMVNQSNKAEDCDALLEDIKAMRSAWQYVHETTSPAPDQNPSQSTAPTATGAAHCETPSSGLQVSI